MSVTFLHLSEVIAARGRIIGRDNSIRFCLPGHPMVFHAYLRPPGIMFISAREALRPSYSAEQRRDAVLAANAYHQEGHHAKLGIGPTTRGEELTAIATAAIFLVDSLDSSGLERHVLRCCFDVADALHWLSQTLATPSTVEAPPSEWMPPVLNGPWTEPDSEE
ncbi:hypothetical protein CCICO_06405 [Corynebacterium ciconiae DSM 44920]|uniref:hypothetical protein n=1 Tax=Corynebacterium ciconiae TaxID=227319 RepID=UPI000372825C|nr:hypothetical protein [Corynebacterium ciconiae]WKD61308.1 hypothetical protein CCICO_06405 [Corynebacterium ciconiae DSM 44920]